MPRAALRRLLRGRGPPRDGHRSEPVWGEPLRYAANTCGDSALEALEGHRDSGDGGGPGVVAGQQVQWVAVCCEPIAALKERAALCAHHPAFRTQTVRTVRV